jgi:hypothetical protein
MSAEPNIDSREIRVHCVKHAIGFSVPRARRIVCQEGHELAHDFPYDSFWDYCCDCEIFRPSDAFQDKEAESICPLCVSTTTSNLTALNALRREIGRRFLCSLCNCMTVESNEGSLSELFTLVTNGAPASCPGCLNPDSNSLVKHDCDSPLMPVSYMTARDKCPFCNRLITQPTKGLEPILPDADGSLELDSVTTISELAPGGSKRTSLIFESFSKPAELSSHLGLFVGIVSVLIALLIFVLPPASTFAFRRWHVLRNHKPLVEPIECIGKIVEGDHLILKAHAQDPDKDALSFVWTLPAGLGRIEKSTEDASRATFYSEGVRPGPVVIELTVSDEYESAAPEKKEIYVSMRLNHPPELVKTPTCNCVNTEVRAGESLSLEAFAEDKDGDPLIYEWKPSIPGVGISEVQSAHGSRAIIDTSGLSPQSGAEPLTIFLTIKDNHGPPLLTNVTINVLPRQGAVKSGEAAALQQQTNHAPRFEKFSVSKNLVDEGENVELRAEVIDPDGNLPLYYDWTTTAGAIQYNRGTAILSTTGVSASDVEVTLIVTDGIGGRTSLRTTVTVRPRTNKSPLSSPSPPMTKEAAAPSPKT